MVRKYHAIAFILFLSLLAAGHCLAQVTPPASYNPLTRVNYVREWSATAPIQDSTGMVTRPLADVKLTTQYVDGLGRPLQTVVRQISPMGKDLVTPVVYDTFGREPYKYLPFIADSVQAGDATGDGNFKLDAFQQQAVFSQGQYPGQRYYYGRTDYEPSPLNRPLTTYAPGNSWVGGAKGVTLQYLVNTTNDSVRIWSIAAAPGSLPVTTASFGAGLLYKNVTVDEAGHQVVGYKDMQGKVLLKKVQISNTPAVGPSGWLNTYYIYDDMDNLRFVIQPKAVQTLLGNGWTFATAQGDSLSKELCFRYEYDERKRMIIKKVPGAGEVWMVYDGRDRLVMTQDSVLRRQQKWLVTRYDGLNRPDSTVLIIDSTHAGDRLYHQNLAASSSNYPVVASYTNEVQTMTYYDDYSWAGSPSGVALSTPSQAKLISTYNTAPDYAVAPTAYMITRGIHTGSKIRVLDSTGTYLSSLLYYDDHGRIVQTQTTNYTGATDTLTAQYNFSGQPLRVLLNHQKAQHTVQHHDVLTKISYDAGLRLKAVWKNVDGVTGDQLIDSIQYNELFQLQAKYLGSSIDKLTYDYNIHGWMTAINKQYLKDSAANYFGMELSYDTTASITGSPYAGAQYNGNVAGLTWKTRGDSTKRRYDFVYDNVNRLTGANFLQKTASGSWSNSLVDYTVSNLTYDANGNIMSMFQKGFKWNGSSLIDSLIYRYPTASNKLYQVTDGDNDSLSQLGDFHYKGTQQDTAYFYDGNGNMVKDFNKSIDNIVYNYLNLPQKIHVKGKGDILYTYDAAGNKLAKLTNDSLSKRAMTTLYLNGFVYQRTDSIAPPTAGIDTLQFLSHEEGRFRWALHFYQNGTAKYGWERDFFEKDHLGNTRMVLTTQSDTGFYAATMEAAFRAKENALFYNIPQTAYSRTLAGYPVDLSMTNPNDSIIMLNGTTGRTQGPAIILKVMAGDTISVGATTYYTSQSGTGTNPSITDVLTSLASGVVGITGGGKGTIGQLNTTSSPLYPGLSNFITNKDGTVAGKPRAYLNYMFLDDQYQYDSVISGAKAVGNATAGTLTTLAQTGIVAGKNGFVYVWVSNETQGWPVFFDNLNVQVRTGSILEETHYYPFGLTMAGISDKAFKGSYKENKYRYNGKELQNKEFSDGAGLEEYDYGARFQDPQLGVWHTIDPLADKSRRWSPYAYAYNNPIRYLDPDGMANEEGNNRKGDKMVRVKYLKDTKTGAITSQEVSEGEYQTATGGGQYNIYSQGGGDNKGGGDPTKVVRGNLFAKHGKDWLPGQNLSPAVVRAKSKIHNSFGGIDNTYVAPPLSGPYVHPGLQVVVWGTGAPGIWNPGGFDPKKKTLYFNFNEEMQQIFGIMSEYGERPSTERPKPGDELENRIKEDALKDPDDNGEKDKYQEGVMYGINSDELYPRYVIKNKDGTVDTIQYGGNKNGKDIDTIRQKK